MFLKNRGKKICDGQDRERNEEHSETVDGVESATEKHSDKACEDSILKLNDTNHCCVVARTTQVTVDSVETKIFNLSSY